MPLDQFSERVPVTFSAQWDHTITPTTAVQIGTTAPKGDYRIDTWQISNLDTIDHTFQIIVNMGVEDYVGALTVPAGAGSGTVPPIDVLAQLLPSVNHYLWVTGGDFPGAVLGEAINTGKFVYIFLLGGQY